LAADRAYVAALRMLARRELCEAQLRTRLERRQFDPGNIDAALTQLRRERALDDRRTALACARTEALVKHRGRARVLRSVERLGVSPAMARAAVNEVFNGLDEREMIAAAIDRRLRHGMSLGDAATSRRVHRYLLGQGFDPATVADALRKRGAVFFDP
jgi:SOS response regulatory protein OraA/RecX